MEGVAVRYFTDLFSTSSPAEPEAFLEEVPSLVTDDQNLKLMVQATEEEVRTALFMVYNQG